MAVPQKKRTMDKGDNCSKKCATWQTILECTLPEWERHPGRFAEDDLTPPSAKALDTACQVAMYMRDCDREPPLRVVPNGDDGIVFERSQREIFETIEIQEDGSAECVLFRDGRLDSRTPLVLRSPTVRC